MDHEDIVTIHDRSNNEERIFPLRQSSNSNILEHYGNWLLSIPRDDMPLLSQTDEYEAFVNAFKNLELAHRKSILQHQEISQMEDRPVSFLQHLALDDMLLRIFEFLPCTTLVKTSQTCHRFHMLSKRSARQRTVHMKGYYYLGSEMKLLRAKEQIEGILPDHTPIVRVPLLGLGRRIYVSNSGDEEYNGIYFCTGSNGNGFLFTKPRDANEWSTQDLMEMEDDIVGGVGDEYRQRGNNLRERRDWNNSIINDEGEEIYPGRIPRCIISKRFSNEVCPYLFGCTISFSCTKSLCCKSV